MADETMRMIEYHANERGFLRTNELGTESKNPTDAPFEPMALTGEQAAFQYRLQGGSCGGAKFG